MIDDLDECTCSCHANDGELHIVPCCEPCRFCERPIDRNHLRSHEVRCSKKIDDDRSTTS